jgi:hypothetical protein
MTPTIMAELAAVDALIRTLVATMDMTKPGDAEQLSLALQAISRLGTARQALHDMARAPVPADLRVPARFPPRLRVIEGGAA